MQPVYGGGAATVLSLGLSGDTGEMSIPEAALFSFGISVTMGVSRLLEL